MMPLEMPLEKLVFSVEEKEEATVCAAERASIISATKSSLPESVSVVLLGIGTRQISQQN